MQINSQNHRNGKNGLFGLLPVRLAYLAGREAPPEHIISRPEKEKKSFEQMQKEIDKIEAQREAYENRIKKSIEEYNKKTSDRYERKDKPFLEPLKTDLNDIDAIVAQIDRILTTPYRYKREKEWYSLLNPAPKNYDGGRGKELLAIRAMLTDSAELQGERGTIFIDRKFIDSKWNAPGGDYINPEKLDPLGTKINMSRKIGQYKGIRTAMESYLDYYPHQRDKKYEELRKAFYQIDLQVKLLEASLNPTVKPYGYVEGAYAEALEELTLIRGQRLVDSMETIRLSKEKLADWEKEPAYKDWIKPAFDRAKKDPEFAEFFNLSDGEISNASKREMEMLFMTVMRETTDNFRHTFILGGVEEFGEDHVENRKRFPFIYNEWLKYQGIKVEDINSMQQKVNEVEVAIVASGIPDVATIVNNNKELTDVGPYMAKYVELEKEPDSRNKYSEMETQLHKMARDFKERASQIDVAQEKVKAEKAAENLERWEELMKEKKLYFGQLKNKKGVETAFTRSNLNTRPNIQILVEICMRKFMKAKKMVDQPFEKDDWRNHYHPTIRRLLIATVYKRGVSEFRLDRYGNEQYVEDINPDHYWMFGEMAKSTYFNRLEVGKNMDPEHRRILLVARIANKTKEDLAVLQTTKEILMKVIAVKRARTEAQRLRLAKKLYKYPAKLIKLFMQEADVAALDAKLEEVEQDEAQFKEFLKYAAGAIKNPYSKESDEFFKKVANGEYEWTTPGGKERKLITAKELKAFESDLHKIEFGYNIFNRDYESDMQFFESFGGRIEGLYDAYLAAVKEKPEMKVERWLDYLHSRDASEFMKLHDFLGEILSESNKQFKEDFLAVFKTLQGYGSPSDIEKTDKERAVALSIFSVIKSSIEHREEKRAAIEQGEAEAIAKLEGMTIGDKIEEYGRGIFDMTFGPGQSWTNRAAGAIMIFGVLKMAKKAWKGDDKLGKLFRYSFIALAAELGSKHIRGKGLIEEYLGLETVAEAISGSYKAALMEYSSEYMQKKAIEPEQQAAALYELDKVPFKDIMAWYNSPTTNKESGMAEGKPDLFPKGIDTSNIIRGVTWDKRNEELEARRVVIHTVRKFFEYVGHKDHKGEEDGAKMLEERWIKMIDDPDYKPDHSEFGLAPALVKKLRTNPKDLTWGMVMENEIYLSDAEKTKKKYGIDPYTEYISGAFNGFRRWSRQELQGRLYGHAEDFFEAFGDKKDQVKEFLGEVGENFGRDLEFAKDEVVFWFEGNKYKIRRFLGMHWELIKEGVKLPFGIIYKVDQLVVPWTLNKLRQIKAIAEKADFHSIDRDLGASDIISDPLVLGTANQTNSKKNKEFAYYGLYQDAFLDAYLKGYLDAAKVAGVDVNTLTTEQKLNLMRVSEQVKLPPDRKMEMYNESAGVGYYVSETTLEDIGIDPKTTQLTPNAIFNKMNEKSHEDATFMFRKKDPNLSHTDIEKFMYPIHVIKKTADPQKLYVFWRMPLHGSAELEMKRMEKWSDYYDPNHLKHRPPFMVDPSKSFRENMINALTKSVDPTTRVVVGDVAAWASQIPRLAFGTLETIGNIVTGGEGAFYGKGWRNKTKWLETLTKRDEGTLQGIDELSTAAEHPRLPMSQFYKDPEHAATYKMLLEFARQRRQALYTEVFLDKAYSTKKLPYSGNMYLDKPQDFYYGGPEGLAAFYEEWKKENRGLPKLERALKGRVKDYQAPTP